ncbi:MAG: hypothetical protein AB2A00_07115 [Myxococcota bacterium]
MSRWWLAPLLVLTAMGVVGVGVRWLDAPTAPSTSEAPAAVSPSETRARPWVKQVGVADRPRPAASPAPVVSSTSTELREALVEIQDVIRAGDLHHALELLDALQADHPDNPALMRQLCHVQAQRAVDLVEGGQLAEAEQGVARLTRECRDDEDTRKVRVHLLLAQARAETDLLRREWLLKSVLELEPGNAQALLALGEMADRRNQLGEAIGYLERALQSSDEVPPRAKERLAELRRHEKVEGRFQQVQRSRFKVHWEGEERASLGDTVVAILDEAHNVVGLRLGLYPPQDIPVVIYTGAQYLEANDVPDWTGGVFDGKIRIREGDTHPDRLRNTLYHEYVHALLRGNIRTALPTWFHEGLAQHLEPGSATKDPLPVVARALESNALPQWAALRAGFLQLPRGQARVAYGESLLIVRWLEQRGGSSVFATLLAALVGGRSFEEAVLLTWGSDLATLEQAWLHDLTGEP